MIILEEDQAQASPVSERTPLRPNGTPKAIEAAKPSSPSTVPPPPPYSPSVVGPGQSYQATSPTLSQPRFPQESYPILPSASPDRLIFKRFVRAFAIAFFILFLVRVTIWSIFQVSLPPSRRPSRWIINHWHWDDEPQNSSPRSTPDTEDCPCGAVKPIPDIVIPSPRRPLSIQYPPVISATRVSSSTSVATSPCIAPSTSLD